MSLATTASADPAYGAEHASGIPPFLAEECVGDCDYMHARYYWPLYGRFTTPDPIGGDMRLPQSWNRYAYVYNNPTNYVDPHGLFVGSLIAALGPLLNPLNEAVTVTSTAIPVGLLDVGLGLEPAGFFGFMLAPIDLQGPNIDVQIQALQPGFLQGSVLCSGGATSIENLIACGQPKLGVIATGPPITRPLTLLRSGLGGVRLSSGVAEKIASRGITRAQVRTALERGTRFWDPKNKVAAMVLEGGFASGKSLIVGFNPVTGTITTAFPTSRIPLRFLPWP